MAHNNNRAATQARDGQVIAGIEKNLQNVPSLQLEGETYTPTSLTALIESRIKAAQAVDVAKASWLDAVKTYEAIDAKVTPAMRGLRQYAFNAYGRTSPKLADFGFRPPATATQTTEQKQTAVQKRRATRAARGTTGPKAKLKVTGETVKQQQLQDALAQANQQLAASQGQAHPPAAAPAPVPAQVLVAPNGAPPAATAPKA